MAAHHLVPRVWGLLLSPKLLVIFGLVACSQEVPCPVVGGCGVPDGWEAVDAAPDAAASVDQFSPPDAPDAVIPDVTDPVPDVGPALEVEALPDIAAADAGGDLQNPEDTSDPADATPGVDIEVPFDPCDDENPCTIDETIDGKCTNTYQYGICCNANAMCNDDDPCTEDLCAQGLCVHAPSCCVADSDCADPDGSCSLDRCVNGACLHTPTGAAGCCTSLMFEATFDDGTTGGMQVSNTFLDVGWHVSDAVEATTPPGSLRYARFGGPDYDSGVEHRGRTALPPMVLPPGVRTFLRFDLLLDIEPGLAFDLFKVELVDLGLAPVGQELAPSAEQLDTVPIVTLWDKSKAVLFFDWQPVDIELTAWAGHAVILRFSFDTVDNQANDQTGVFLDGLRVDSECTANSCSLDVECADDSPYTEDRCLVPSGETVGGCAYTQSSTYCGSSSECDDGEPCTVNSCVQGVCQFSPSPSCCLADAQCDDGNACTADDCIGLGGPNGGYCINVHLAGCCLGQSDCEDGNPCTVDACPFAGQKCAHTLIAGCCAGNGDCADTDPCTLDLCDVGSCVYDVACCASDAGCDDSDVCTADHCVSGVCAHDLIGAPACCIATLFNADFTSGSTSGFSGLFDSNNGDGVTWLAVTNDGAQSPSGAYHFGSYGGTYATGERVRGITESGPFFVPVVNAVELSFFMRLENEWSMGAGNIAWDRFEVSVRLPDDNVVGIWSSVDGVPQWWTGSVDAPTGAEWVRVEDIDLSPFRGMAVRLRFEFDSVDDEANAFGGLWVDDVLVAASCE